VKLNANDIEAWAAEYDDQPAVQQLVRQIERDRRLPQPGNFPRGSSQYVLAEARQRVLLAKARALGYQPPVRELAVTIAKEAIKTEALGLSGLENTAVGKALDKMPAPERSSRVEREAERRKKKRKKRAEQGFGRELTPWGTE
jgi:hypothetical protein